MTGHTTPIRRVSAAAGLLLVLSVSAPVQAEPTDKPKANRNSGRHSTKNKADQPDSDEGKKDDGKKDDGKKDVDTEHLFGFTEGADAGEQGEQEAVVDAVTRIGKRKGSPGPSTYRVLDTRFAYQFNPIDKLSIEFSAFGTLRRQRNVLDLDDKSYGTFDGASLEVKYQFLKGSTEQPLGLALEVRPRFTRILPVEGQGADIFDIESLLQLDVQVMPDRLSGTAATSASSPRPVVSGAAVPAIAPRRSCGRTPWWLALGKAPISGRRSATCAAMTEPS